MSSQPRLVLASASPRRRELLSALGLDFEVRLALEQPPELAKGEPSEVALANARAKVFALEAAEDELLVGADTIVVIAGAILGKPNSAEEAKTMLRRLSGNRHEVLTGVAVRSREWLEADVARTSVWFRPLEEWEIEAYVATGEPLDKAGAYGIQERASVFVSHIEGDYFNVVGLPLALLDGLLKKRGCGILALTPR